MVAFMTRTTSESKQTTEEKISLKNEIRSAKLQGIPMSIFFSMLTSTNRPSVAQQFSGMEQKIRTQYVYDDNGVIVLNAELPIRIE